MPAPRLPMVALIHASGRAPKLCPGVHVPDSLEPSQVISVHLPIPMHPRGRTGESEGGGLWHFHLPRQTVIWSRQEPPAQHSPPLCDRLRSRRSVPLTRISHKCLRSGSVPSASGLLCVLHC